MTAGHHVPRELISSHPHDPVPPAPHLRSARGQILNAIAGLFQTEAHLQRHLIARDLSVLYAAALFEDFEPVEVAHSVGRAGNGVLNGIITALVRGADQFEKLINLVCHGVAPAVVDDGRHADVVEMNIRAPGYKHSAIAATVHAGWQSDELLNDGLREGIRREELSRIDARVVEAHAPVQARAGGAAGLADRADHVAARDVLARLHVDALHMAVHGHQALAVVDEHGVAVEEVIAGRDHASRRGCAHAAPGRGGDVAAAVRGARQAVEDAAPAERAAQGSVRGELELQRHLYRFAKRGEGGVHFLFVAFDALQILRRGFDLAFVLDGEALRLVSLVVYREALRGLSAVAITYRDDMFTEGAVERQTHDGVPRVIVAYHHRALLVEIGARCRAGAVLERDHRDAARHGRGFRQCRGKKAGRKNQQEREGEVLHDVSFSSTMQIKRPRAIRASMRSPILTASVSRTIAPFGTCCTMA